LYQLVGVSRLRAVFFSTYTIKERLYMPNIKHISRNKFKALDPRKRLLYLAWILENRLNSEDRDDTAPGQDPWMDTLRRYISFLPPEEARLLPRDLLMDDAGGEIRGREMMEQAIDEICALAEFKRRYLPAVFADSPAPEQHARRVLPLRVIVDRIRSPYNAGAIIRCAEAAGCESVYLTGYTPGPDHPKVSRASMSAERYLSVFRSGDALSAVRECTAAGFIPVALELTDQSVDYRSFPFPHPLVLVVGNEELGIAEPVLAACRHEVHIPMLGVKQSLNVSQALAVCLFECIRRWSEEGLPAAREM
jgi:tRNA G18 (ribose-2'-O)-methylase SpoU